MTEPVYLDPATPEHRRALASVLTVPKKPRVLLSIQCDADRCRRLLARIYHTELGPGFLSTWTTGLSPLATYVNDDHDGRRRITQENGPGIKDQEGRDGVVALLRFAADTPALLVRCERHGDTVLDRAQVLEHLLKANSRRTWRVTVTHPVTPYRYHDEAPSWWPSSLTKRRPSTTSIAYQWADTLEERIERAKRREAERQALLACRRRLGPQDDGGAC